ncbi:MAG: cytochrome c oxidase subunit II [Anaerolineae bacterium]
MKHIVIASVLVVIVTVLVIFGLTSVDLVPQLASEEGQLVDQLFAWQVYVIAFIFSLILVFMLYSVVVFRRKPGDTSDGVHVRGNTTLEIAWTLIPLIVVLGFGVVSAQHLTDMTTSDPDQLVVEVTGFQFGWNFEYPQYDVSSSELYLPVGRQVLFRITSRDVIHSFWVPEFRIKQDAVPGRWTTLLVTPTTLGDFRIRCAELCGYAHAAMYAPVVVVEPEDFEAWLAGQEVQVPDSGELTPVQQGEQLSRNNGCLSCHSIDGSVMVGPTWLGLYGSERPLDDGSSVVADEAYLRTSILEPQSQIVEGFDPIMPAAYTALSDEELTAIIEYIKSLTP